MIEPLANATDPEPRATRADIARRWQDVIERTTTAEQAGRWAEHHLTWSANAEEPVLQGLLGLQALRFSKGPPEHVRARMVNGLARWQRANDRFDADPSGSERSRLRETVIGFRDRFGVERAETFAWKLVRAGALEPEDVDSALTAPVREVADLRSEEAPAARRLILDGLAERWGEIDESLNPDLADLLGHYATGRVVVARAEGRVVGTGAVIPLDSAIAEIRRMSVDRQHRGQGIGRKVLFELVNTARSWGCSAVVCETTAAWEDAVRFYESFGFVVTHRTDSEFGPDQWLIFDL